MSYDRNRLVLDREDHAMITDQIFKLRQIFETVTAGRNATIFTFEFRKPFDSVHQPALWKILWMYGFPEQIISILQNLYHDSNCTVRTNGDW